MEKMSHTEWFTEARFGMFIHWGIYSLANWPYYTWRGNGGLVVDGWEQLQAKFAPSEYDPHEWVDLAKEAGMKYIVITAKHVDGFCMFDSSWTTYSCMYTPARRDLVGELVDACHEGGMRIGFYYSILDYHHPLYRDNFAGYLQYMEEQIRELCTNYGKIDIMWFDALWNYDDKAWQGEPKKLLSMIRELQPQILINDRCGIKGDFITPEQEVPEKPLQEGELWESCITINRSWGYKKSDRNFKSTQELIRLLVEVVSKGGNLLLNVGPMPDGRIQPEFVERLKGIGAWMKVNDEAIYGTQAGPLRDTSFGQITAKGKRLYLHIFKWPAQPLEIVGLQGKVEAAWLLQDKRDISFHQSGERITFQLPTTVIDPVDTVLALDWI